MNKKPLDKTKKTNIKCEHCQYWVKSGYVTPYAHLPIMGCDCKDSQWNGKERMYWNRCKFFRWHEKYADHTTEKGADNEQRAD